MQTAVKKKVEKREIVNVSESTINKSVPVIPPPQKREGKTRETTYIKKNKETKN